MAVDDYVAPTSLPVGPGSVSWKINAEPVPFLGGGRALLLQVAHPKVAAGVEHHSSYASDPWARLFRTVDVMLKLGFGSPEVSARQVRLLEGLHRRVHGTTSDGEPYDALDPALLMWVWATLGDTAVRCHELAFSPLSALELDRFYEEWKLVAHACGVPEGTCPPTWGDFLAYVDHTVATELRATPEGLKVAHATAVPPLPFGLGRLAAWPHQLVTAGLFPETLRAEFGFEWDERRQRQFDQLWRLVRIGVRLVPADVRTAGARWLAGRPAPLRVGWLQRRGTRLTPRRMAELEPGEHDPAS